MPLTEDEIRYRDDDSEFLDENRADDGPADPGDAPLLPEGHKPEASLLRLAESSLMSKGQCSTFLASVELDLLRPPEERLNLRPLFEACCRNGSKTWLNPALYLKELDVILEKFLCSGIERSRVISPLTALLTELAEQGINPAAFLQYIILPRIEEDNDWRRWNELHIDALKLIGDFLVSMKGCPPFDREYLGRGESRLVRDIVLVKYAGRPLSGFPLSELKKGDLLERCRGAWQMLSLDNPFTILFMKTNLLHFMYTMSGRIDLVQLVAVIENMPAIESGFRENFPERCFNLDLKTLKMSLYNYDMSRSVYDRKMKGFSDYDFVVELRAYLSIIVALLGTGSGIFLCGYFAARLSALKSPDAACLFERLILAIEDNGGKNIYIWHTRRMLSLPSNERGSYIDMIELNGGVDPSYPVAERLFDGEEIELYSERAFNAKLKTLGITKDDFDLSLLSPVDGGRGEVRVPHHAWISAYLKHYPERRGDIDRYRNEVVAGKDRTWNDERVREIDGLGIPLHRPLLHSVIPGLSGALTYKSNSFAGLMLQYRSVAGIEPLAVSHEFRVPVRETSSFDKLLSAKVRSRVNMTVIREAWSCIESQSGTSPDNVTYFINMEYTKLKEAYAPRSGELVEAGSIMASLSDGAEKEKLEKKVRSIEKGAAHIKAQMELYEALLREADYMNSREKVITAVIVAGKQAGTGDDFARFAVDLLLDRYSSDATLQGRLEVLRNDVAIELIHLGQLEMLVETIDTLGRVVAGDSDLKSALESMISRNEDLEGLLAPFILLKSKKLSMEALDAALRKITGFARLAAERAKWQEILESFSEQGTGFFDPYRIYASRSVVDAYYGDMGSICLSGIPEAVEDPALQVFRLASDSDRKIKGVMLMYRSEGGLSSCMKKMVPFWHSFAFNPIPSMLHRMTRRQQLYLYLNFRRVLERVCRESGMPVVLSGINSWGIVSNDSSFADLILAFERRFNGVEVNDAAGLSLLYSEESYSEAIVVADPARGETFIADKLLEGFYRG
ncbi:MAG TPA: hypothetical protein PK906_15910 [Spirochaetota bacterium]|nr:hypothetical protein [Spirochaetota bacterium]